MPVLNSLLDHKVYGREFKKGLAEGLEKGRERGLEIGLEKGGTQLLHHMLVRRFKKLPKWAEVRLASASHEEIEGWGERLLEANTLREVFAEPPARQ